MSIAQVASVHCEVRREISPCTCEQILANKILVECDGVGSFNQVVDALHSKFDRNTSIQLTITNSQLDDLETRTFEDMNITLKNLKLNFDNLKTIPDAPFRNLSQLHYLGLADSHLEEVPRHLWQHMPHIGSVDLARGNIKGIREDDFKGLPIISTLVLSSNKIKYIEKNSLPNHLTMIHLGRNELTTLNGTLRDMNGLIILFLNGNHLTSIENELPIAPNLHLVMLQSNHLTKLPDNLKLLPRLKNVYVGDNPLTSLDGLLRHASNMESLIAENCKINYLAEDEFLEATKLESLRLGNNEIRSLNNSLLPLKNLKAVNFATNMLTEFSLDEIRGLRNLRFLDLAHNKINKITGRMENNVESDCNIEELDLQDNLLTSLDGSLMGLNSLNMLNLANNQITSISPGDFNGMQNLEESSTTILPKLKKLYLAHNKFVHLHNDFLGFPTLCMADLSNNQIISISPELVSKTRCNNYGVSSKLEIGLQENPIFCKDDIADVVRVMEERDVRLVGDAHCFVAKEDNPDSLDPILDMLESQHNLPTVMASNHISQEVTKNKPTTTTMPTVVVEENVVELNDAPETVLIHTTTPFTLPPLLQSILPTTTEMLATQASPEDEDNNLPQEPLVTPPTVLAKPTFGSTSSERTDLPHEQEEPPEEILILDESRIE